MLYAFDGTWDRWDSDNETLDHEPDRNGPFTNVVLFAMAYRDHVGPIGYVDGVGTRLKRPGAALGGALGIGATRRVNEQFKRLRRSFRNGDRTIDVIGYSRGAAVARMFVDRIAGEFDEIQDAQGRPLTEPPRIRFLGLFDTVASFGFAWTDEEWNFQPALPANVDRACHALSMDECRETFDVDRIAEPFDAARVLEVWFRGGHGDIGGNGSISKPGADGWRDNRARTNISLAWMMSEARAAGVGLPQDVIAKVRDATDPGAPITAAKDGFDFAALGIIPRRDRPLEMDVDDHFHETTRHPEPKRTIHGVPAVKVPEGATRFVQ